jgi:hypothetical protein
VLLFFSKISISHFFFQSHLISFPPQFSFLFLFLKTPSMSYPRKIWTKFTKTSFTLESNPLIVPLESSPLEEINGTTNEGKLNTAQPVFPLLRSLLPRTAKPPQPSYRIGKNVTFQLLVTMSWIFLLTQYRDVLLTRMNRGN